MKKIILGADHRGYYLKENIRKLLSADFEIVDVGTNSAEPVDYPDIASALSKMVLANPGARGILICGSGVGACVAANKFKGIRAAICHDAFSAHQGVEDDDMNVICLGGGIVGESLAIDIIRTFISANFKEEERYIRRLDKIRKIEDGN